MPDLYGVEAAEGILQSASWPSLRLKPNERAIFHCLTDGRDANFAAARFHVFGEFPDQRRFVCVRVLTGGEEECHYCQEGPSGMENQFGIWLWVAVIWHATDNPDEGGEGWTAKKIEGRTLFGEKVNKPLLLRLKAGRNKAWYKQFSTEWVTRGNLMLWQYELRRVGEGLETEYLLRAVKEQALAPAIIESEDVKALPTIPTIFRASLGGIGGAPMAGSSLLGGDSLDGGGDLELPSAQTLPDEDGDNDLL